MASSVIFVDELDGKDLLGRGWGNCFLNAGECRVSVAQSLLLQQIGRAK